MEELDEFGIPIKKTSSDIKLDEFGIPVKKKVGGEKFISTSPDFEKGQAFAEKGFLMQAEGTRAPKKQRISIEPSLSGILGAPPKVSVVEEGEQSPFADFSSAIIKGQLQGKVANILSAGKTPSPEELGEIAQLQSDIQLFPQSKSEKVYQEKGLTGLFKESPALGVEFVAETMANSLSSLFEASKRTVPQAALAGAVAGAPFAGIGALVGAGTGMIAGQSAAGYNLSTSQDILSSLSDNGVDITNKDSLIKAFSDEKKMAQVRKTAAQYGIPILIFDAATAGLAGKLAAGAVGKGIAKKVLAGLGESGLQMAGGAGGELFGQIASGKPINWDEVAMEALAEVPGGATEVATGVLRERSKTASNNRTLATQIATQGVENGKQDAVLNLNRDLANKVITPEQHQEGLAFVEKAAQVAEKVPENITGENKAKSIELLAERDEIKEKNQNLLQQKQGTDEAYHAGIDQEIKVNEERIKKIDSEVYDIAKVAEKENIKQAKQGAKKYIIDGQEVTQEDFEAMQGKPVGTKTIIEKPSEEQKAKEGPSVIMPEENVPLETTEIAPEKDISKKSIQELEKRQSEIEDAKSGTPEYKEFGEIDKELQNREWRSVFDVSLDKIPSVVDEIMKKEKEQPYGFGSYMDSKDARLTKEISEKYSKQNIKNISDNEIIKDFKDAMFGNPSSWYSDGLKLRESLKEAQERGINVFDKYVNEFIKDGYTREEAISVASRKLEPILKNISEKTKITPSGIITQEAQIEPIKEVTLVDAYNELPKAEKLRKKATESLINSNFDSIYQQLIDKKKIEKIC